MSYRPHVIPAILFAGLSFANGVNAAVTAGIDTIQPGDLTIMLKNFNGSAQEHSSLTSNVTSPVSTVTWTGNQSGYGTYTVSSGVSDPRVEFYTAGNTPYDVNTYNYVRLRQRANVTGASSELWPNRAVNGNTQLVFGVTTSFTEYNQAWKNPNDPNIKTATDGGFRWDPVPNTANTGANFDLDYFMVDRGRVKGFEFDVDGSDFQGWSLNSQYTGQTVLNSSLKGTTNGVDSYMTYAALDIAASDYKYVELRMKMDAANILQFFWTNSLDTTLAESKSLTLATATDGEWHTYLLDFSNEATWANTIKTFRVDTGSKTGQNFELDYIRFREIGAVPEPGRFALLALAGMSFILRRRRKV